MSHIADRLSMSVNAITKQYRLTEIIVIQMFSARKKALLMPRHRPQH